MTLFMQAETSLAKALGSQTMQTTSAQLEALFDSLMAQDSAALFRLASGFTDTPADRDDLFQDMILAIWQSLPRFRGESSPRTYLFRIARNRGIAHLVGRGAIHGNVEELPLPDPRPDPQQQMEVQQQRNRLLEAVRKLPFLYREVITLALEELSYAEMAQVIGVSEGNVGKRLSRAKAALRELLES
jgi:RNA polymerase sigma-70 factor (ECF subfamily)